MAEQAAHGAPEINQNREYRLLADSIPNLAWIAQSDGSIFWYNRRWYEYTGTSASEMEGWGWQTVHDPSTLPDVLARWRRSIATGQSFEMTFPLRGGDGVFRPFLTRSEPVKDDKGTVVRWFGTCTEVGEELRAVAALRESEQRFRTATEAVSAVLWTNDATGEMQGDQPGWSAFTGQTREQYQGYGWAKAVHPEDAQPTIAAWQQVVHVGKLFAFEHRVRRFDGVYRLCSVRALPIRHEDGSVREWVGVHTDITAQRQAEQALRRNDRLAIAGRLAATMAHEISNPLDSIHSLLYLLRHTSLDPEQQALCETMEGEIRRVSDIANDSLKLHRQATAPAAARSEDLVRSVLALFSGRARIAGIEVKCRFSATKQVYGREGELRQVLANLVGNAIDAMTGAGPSRILHLRTRDAVGPSGEAALLFTLADTGPGIPPDLLSTIFEPFVTTKGDKGTGLGLWISNEIIHNHHGRITVRSSQNPERHGTVFHVILPLHPSTIM